MKKATIVLIGMSVMISFCFTANAQKKKKSNKEKDSVGVKYAPPRIVKDEEVLEEAVIAVPQEGVKDEGDYGTGTINPSLDTYRRDRVPLTTEKTTNKVPFDNKGKYYLVSVRSSNSYTTKYGIEDSAGKVILPSVFSSIAYQNEDYDKILVQFGYRYSLLNGDFKTILPMEYNRIECIPNTNLIIVKTMSNRADLLDEKGNSVLNLPQIVNIYSLNITYRTTAKNTLLQIENKLGKKAIYDYKQRKFLVDFSLKSIQPDENIIIIETDSSSKIYDRNYQPINNESYSKVLFSRGGNAIVVVKKDKRGLISQTGAEILPCEYDVLEPMPNNYAVDIFITAKKGRYSLIDFNGKSILTDTYDYIRSVSTTSGAYYVLVKKNKKVGIKDFLNHDVIPVIYDSVLTSNSYGYTSNLLAIKKGMVVSYSSKGIKQDSLNCDSIELLYRDNKKYLQNGKYGFIQSGLDKTTTALYDNIEQLNNGYSYYSNVSYYKVQQNKKYGLLSITGKLCLAPSYDMIEEFDSNVLLVRQNGKYGLLRSNDLMVVAEPVYDMIGSASEGGYSSSESRRIVGYIGIKDGAATPITITPTRNNYGY